MSLTNDAATIARSLDPAHPIARYLVDVINSIDETCGDGSTSLLLMAEAALLEGDKMMKGGEAREVDLARALSTHGRSWIQTSLHSILAEMSAENTGKGSEKTDTERGLEKRGLEKNGEVKKSGSSISGGLLGVEGIVRAAIGSKLGDEPGIFISKLIVAMLRSLDLEVPGSTAADATRHPPNPNPTLARTPPRFDKESVKFENDVENSLTP